MSKEKLSTPQLNQYNPALQGMINIEELEALMECESEELNAKIDLLIYKVLTGMDLERIIYRLSSAEYQLTSGEIAYLKELNLYLMKDQNIVDRSRHNTARINIKKIHLADDRLDITQRYLVLFKPQNAQNDSTIKPNLIHLPLTAYFKYDPIYSGMIKMDALQALKLCPYEEIDSKINELIDQVAFSLDLERIFHQLTATQFKLTKEEVAYLQVFNLFLLEQQTLSIPSAHNTARINIKKNDIAEDRLHLNQAYLLLFKPQPIQIDYRQIHASIIAKYEDKERGTESLDGFMLSLTLPETLELLDWIIDEFMVNNNVQVPFENVAQGIQDQIKERAAHLRLLVQAVGKICEKKGMNNMHGLYLMAVNSAINTRLASDNP
jgi:hypothetical protein